MRRPILSLALAILMTSALPMDEPRSRSFDEPIPLQTGFADVNGIRLFFRVYGEGRRS